MKHLRLLAEQIASRYRAVSLAVMAPARNVGGLTVEKANRQNKAAKRNMIAWGFATLVPDENVRRNHCRAFALWRNETRGLT
jgi:hypothetical protein